MAGFLGNLFGGEDQQGLMAAYSQILQDSGPSRTPRSFMQIAAGGLGAFQQGVESARERAALEERRAMEKNLLGWKVKDAEADYGAQQGTRERDSRIAKRLAATFTGGTDAGGQGGTSARSLAGYDTSYNGTPYTQAEADATFGAAKGMVGYEPGKLNQMMALSRHGMDLGQAAAIVFGGGGQPPGAQGSPGSTPSQGQQSMPGMPPGGIAPPAPGPGPMGGQPGPTPGQPNWFNMGMDPKMALSMQSGKKGNRTQQMVDNMMAKAQIQLEEGDEVGLAKTLDAIQKFRPSADWKEIRKDGRTVNKAFFNDGTEGDTSQDEVAAKLHWEDTGPSTFGLDAYDGSIKARLQNGMTPDGAASNSVARANLQLSRERIGLERERVDQGRGTVVQSDAGPLLVNTRTGTGTAVIGPNGQAVGPKLRDVPGTVRKTLFENDAALRKVDDALKAVDAYPAALGFSNYMGDTIRQRTDPDGVNARALVADIGSLKIHDRSGAAVTASETPRLKPFIPSATDDEATVKKKLGLFKQEYSAIQQDIRETYSREQGYRTPEARQARVDVSSIPSRAIGHLRMDPKLRDAFDAKYGAGAADAVLRK
jgi:hypothetical protein